MKLTPKVYIVGAGPGAPDLMTVRAVNYLKSADVVLYDDLFGDEILDLIPEKAEKIYAGKVYNDNQDQASRQNRIHDICMRGYKEGKVVVRLKTGDPLIFGRGSEEFKYFAENNIPFELVPGITAGFAAANQFAVTLTERFINKGLLITSGRKIETARDHLLACVQLLQMGNPLVVYMGLHNLPNILNLFVQEGISADMGITIASKVSHSTQDYVYGTFAEIEEKLNQHPLESPTVMIIGKYVQPFG